MNGWKSKKRKNVEEPPPGPGVSASARSRNSRRHKRVNKNKADVEAKQRQRNKHEDSGKRDRLMGRNDCTPSSKVTRYKKKLGKKKPSTNPIRWEGRGTRINGGQKKNEKKNPNPSWHWTTKSCRDKLVFFA